MMLIDAKSFINLQMYDAEREEWYTERMTIEECLDRYADEGCPPSIDAVEVVRCGKCDWWNCETKGCKRNPSVKPWWDDDFCSYGEREQDPRIVDITSIDQMCDMMCGGPQDE